MASLSEFFFVALAKVFFRSRQEPIASLSEFFCFALAENIFRLRQESVRRLALVLVLAHAFALASLVKAQSFTKRAFPVRHSSSICSIETTAPAEKTIITIVTISDLRQNKLAREKKISRVINTCVNVLFQ